MMSSYMAAAATCLLIALVGRIGLRLASDGEDMISWGRGLLPALIGGMPIAFFAPRIARSRDRSLDLS